MSMWAWLGIGFGALLVLVAIHDMTQKRHAILRNFPIVGHFRYWLETIGPELRQYLTAVFLRKVEIEENKFGYWGFRIFTLLVDIL